MAPHQTSRRAPAPPRTSSRPVRLLAGSATLLLTGTLLAGLTPLAQAAPARPTTTNTTAKTTAKPVTFMDKVCPARLVCADQA